MYMSKIVWGTYGQIVSYIQALPQQLSILLQAFNYLVSYRLDLPKELGEFVFITVGVHAITKGSQVRLWPVGLHQPKYVGPVLSSGVREVPPNDLWNPLQLFQQGKWCSSVLLGDVPHVHNSLGSDLQLIELLLQ